MISMAIGVFIAWFVLSVGSGIGLGWVLWGLKDKNKCMKQCCYLGTIDIEQLSKMVEGVVEDECCGKCSCE